MKIQLLTMLATASLAMSSTPMAQAKFSDCMKTRLGCLDENGPIIPIDQPLVIQVGLKTKIKCEAQALDGKTYLATVELVKNVQATSNQILDYYLAPGVHSTLVVNIGEKVNGVFNSDMFIYAFDSEVKDLTQGGGVSVQAQADIFTRLATGFETINVLFSGSGHDQPLKILSAYHKEQINKYNSKIPFVKEQQITFTDSNCVYY